jgi:hypothetical protein
LHRGFGPRCNRAQVNGELTGASTNGKQKRGFFTPLPGKTRTLSRERRNLVRSLVGNGYDFCGGGVGLKRGIESWR